MREPGSYCTLSSYNRMVSGHLAALCVAMLVVASCGPNIKAKEKVQEAILNRLETNSGLDLKKLDVTTTGVSFNKNMAYATVAFRQKGDPRLDRGMVMTYTLENRGGKWAVVKVGDSQGRNVAGQAPHSAGELPPGHPPLHSVNPPAAASPHGGVREQ
jgi:hypothetical protein